MGKTTVINLFKKKEPVKKKIILAYCISQNGSTMAKAMSGSGTYDEIELLSKNSANHYDVIRARNNDWEEGNYNFYIGHWNDGVV